jgi:citrate lyase subunit beta/citryl-CoA lyase
MIPRTYLFVPGDRPERFDKALASGADAVVLDLEDAVAPERKSLAREAIAGWFAGRAAELRPRIAVRVNDAATPWFAADAAMLAAAGVGLAMLPKTETAAQIEALRRAVPRTGVLALVESARGVSGVDAIAAAPGVERLVFGTLDFALDLDIAPEPEGLAHAAACIAVASRAAGLPAPVAGVTPEIGDGSKLVVDLAWARRLGFGAKLCIHPRQVTPIHDALRPSAAEVAWAQRVLAAVETNQGTAVQVDGRMVDKPVLLRARSLVARAAE